MPTFLLLVSLLSAATLLLLRAPVAPQVPDAVPGELQAEANRAAAAYIAPADHLVRTAATDHLAIASKKRGALLRLSRANPDVDGLALTDRATGEVLTKRGDSIAVPAALPAPQDGPAVSVIDDDLVVAVPVSTDRTLIGSLSGRPPRLPGAPPGQRVLITGGDGAIVAESTAHPVVPPALVQSVAASTARGESGFSVDDSRLAESSSRGILALPGRAQASPDPVAVVGGVPLHGAAERSGLSALIARDVPVTPSAMTSPGRIAAIAVASGGVLVFILLQLVMVRPVRRLRSDVDGVVADIDAGRRPTAGIRRSRLRQVDRIARCAAQLPLTADGDTRRRSLAIPGTALYVLVGTLFVTALGLGFASIGAHESARTDALTERSRTMVEKTAGTLEGTLTEGLAAVQTAAVPKIGEVESDWTRVVTELHATRPIFRTVYVRDAAQRIVAVAGEAPLAEVAPSAPLAQLNTTGPEPILTAAERTHDGRFTVVAEYDVRALNNVLRSADSPTEVYDSGSRTVLGSDGYISFSPLDDPVLRRNSSEAGMAARAAVHDVAGAEQLVAGQRIGRSEVTAALGWTVLQHREVTAARYTVDPVGRAATVVLGATALVVVGLLLWSHNAIIGPLGRVHRWLTGIADSPQDRPAAGPPPRRLDEVGAVMAGLNHCMNRGDRR